MGPLVSSFAAFFLALCAASAGAAYYGNTPTTFSWIDPVAGAHTAAVWTSGASCTGGTYVNAPGDDDITAQLPIGFTFNFGGTNYTQLQIMTNGRLQFNNSYCGWGTNGVGPPPTYPYDIPTGAPLGGAGNVVRMMRIYGADFDPGASAPGGRVYYATTGVAPNRQFIVTWYNVKEWNSPGSFFNMQIILNEGGDFVYQYKDTVNITTGHAQIAWEISATDYDILSYSGFGSLAYTAIRFYAAPKLAEWRMDESTWTGAAGEVLDTSGSGYNAQAAGGAITTKATPAISTNPGTCGYGVFNGTTNYVAVPATFPNLATSFTIGAWIRTQDRTKSGQRVFIDDQNNTQGYGLSLGDGGAGILRFYTRGASNVILDTPAVIQNNLWYFVAAVVDFATLPNPTKYIYVYDASGSLLTSVSQTFTGWGTDAGPASIGGETSASGESTFKFFGNIDEVKVYSGALPKATLDVLAKETHTCPITGVTVGGFNVFEAATTNGFVAGYIKTKVAGQRFDLGTGNLSIVALNAGAIDTTFTGTVKVELVDASSGGALDVNGCNAGWPVVATLPNQTFGAGSNGRINMNPVPQVNGVVFKNLKFRISFPTAAPTRIGCSNDGFALRPSSIVLGTPTHSTWNTPGNAAALTNFNAVGGVVHKAGDVSGSRNNFTLSASARDALGASLPTYSSSPAGGVSALQLPSGCGACAPGTFITGAWSGAGTITSNSAAYTEVGSVTVHVEDRTFAAIDAIDSSTGERYVDSNPVSLGRFVPDHFDVAPAAAPIFRTFNAIDGQCNTTVALPRRSFTYVGQPFGYANLPQATITARNSDPAGVTTTLYRGTLWKIGGAAVATPACVGATCTFTTAYGATGGAVAETYSYSLDTGATPGFDATVAQAQVATVTSNNNGTGTITYAASDRIAFARSTAAPLAPFTATINNSISVTDNAEGVTQTITTTNPAAFNAIAFDATYIDPVPANNKANKFFYGRMRLQNANGSQLITMPIPMTTEYWNGSAFVTNNFDHCTGGTAAAIAAANIAIGNPQNGLTAAMVSPPVLGGAFTAGRGSLRLQAPGAGRRGSVDVSVNLSGVTAGASCTAGMPASTASSLSFLQGAWCGATYTNDPTARATFGIYRNSNQFIYQQENY